MVAKSWGELEAEYAASEPRRDASGWQTENRSRRRPTDDTVPHDAEATTTYEDTLSPAVRKMIDAYSRMK